MQPMPRGRLRLAEKLYPAPPRELRPQVPPAVARHWQSSPRVELTSPRFSPVRASPSPRWHHARASPRELAPLARSPREPIEDHQRRVSQDWGRRVVGVHEALRANGDDAALTPVDKEDCRRGSVQTNGDELAAIATAPSWRRQETQDVLAQALSSAPAARKQESSQPCSQQEPFERTMVPGGVSASARTSMRGSVSTSARTSMRGSMGETAQFWRAYKRVPGETRGPAWETVSAEEAIAEREEILKEHKLRRHTLMRLINTGQLSEAASEATGEGKRHAGPKRSASKRGSRRSKGSKGVSRIPSPAVHKDEIGRQFEVMSMQRRELAEARKTLEKVVLDDSDRRTSNFGRQLSFILRGYHTHIDHPEDFETLGILLEESDGFINVT